MLIRTSTRGLDQNPGGYDTAFSLDKDNLLEALRTNVVGPACVSQAFLPLVERSTKKMIVNISTTAGSIGFGTGSGLGSYSITKTALNMLVRKTSCRKISDIQLTSYVGMGLSRHTSKPRIARISPQSPSVLDISKPVSWPFAGGMAPSMHTHHSSVNCIVDMGGSDAP